MNMEASSEIQWDVVHQNYPGSQHAEERQPDPETVGTWGPPIKDMYRAIHIMIILYISYNIL